MISSDESRQKTEPWLAKQIFFPRQDAILSLAAQLEQLMARNRSKNEKVELFQEQFFSSLFFFFDWGILFLKESKFY